MPYEKELATKLDEWYDWNYEEVNQSYETKHAAQTLDWAIKELLSTTRVEAFKAGFNAALDVVEEEREARDEQLSEFQDAADELIDTLRADLSVLIEELR